MDDILSIEYSSGYRAALNQMKRNFETMLRDLKNRVEEISKTISDSDVGRYDKEISALCDERQDIESQIDLIERILGSET